MYPRRPFANDESYTLQARQHTGGAPTQNGPSPFRNVGANVMQSPRNPMMRPDAVQNVFTNAGGHSDSHHSGRRASKDNGWKPRGRQASKDNACNLAFVPRAAPPHYLGSAISNSYEHADGFYMGQHGGNDVAGHLGAGLVPRPTAPQYVMQYVNGNSRGNSHGNADRSYMGQHAGNDVAGNLGTGLVPTDQASQHMIGHARGYIDGVFVGQHAGKDVCDNLSARSVPRPGASRNVMSNAQGTADGYYNCQHPANVAGHLGTGMVPRDDAHQYVIGTADCMGHADGFYMGHHAGKSVAGNLEPGCIPTTHASQRVTGNANDLADDLYGGIHARKHVAEGHAHRSVPPFDVADTQGDLSNRQRRSSHLHPQSNDWAVHHCPWQQHRQQQTDKQKS